jgi:hypothetical protein
VPRERGRTLPGTQPTAGPNLPLLHPQVARLSRHTRPILAAAAARRISEQSRECIVQPVNRGFARRQKPKKSSNEVMN